MRMYKLPSGKEITVYEPFSLYDAIEDFMAPMGDFMRLVNSFDINEMGHVTVLNVFEILWKDLKTQIHSRLDAIEEKLGGKVHLACAAHNQNVVEPDTVLEARMVAEDLGEKTEAVPDERRASA